LKAFALTFALASAVVLAGQPRAKPVNKPTTHEVRMEGMKFIPSSLTVKVGDTVVWKNTDIVPHNIFSPQISSSTLQPGDSFKWTATKAGKNAYTCALHPMMHGAVIVEP
jgi:plastocyanin